MNYSTLPERDATDPAALRVLTHNIYGRRAAWERRRDVLGSGLAVLDPDIVLLQETIVVTGYDQVADILGSGYQIAHSATRETDGSGISIASRWPVTELRELDLKVVSPRTGQFACTTLIAAIDAPAPIGPLLVANHFPDYQPDHELERERQTVIAARGLEAIHAARPRHVVLAGDLDAEPDAASLRFLAGKQSLDGTSVCYGNAWDSTHPGEPGHSFTSHNPLVPGGWPFRRIDHIFVRCGEEGKPTLAIAACALVFDEPIGGVWASDHFGLVADLSAT